MMSLLISIVSDTCIYAGLPLSLWISFRILGYPDLSIEQLFVLGGVFCALSGPSAYGLIPLIVVLLVASCILGVICSVIRNYFNVHPILISLAAAYGYYSISLALLGGPNRFLGATAHTPSLLQSGAFAVSIFTGLIIILGLFSGSRFALRVIASGSNRELASRHSLSPAVWQAVGLSISFLFAMASGALFAWRAANVDVSYGSGLLLVSIFVVVITRAVQSRIRITANALALGGFLAIYLAILQLAFAAGMPSQWLRGLNAAALLLLIIAVPKERMRLFNI